MPSYDTPKPITVDVSLYAGRLRVVAGDRADTVVEVRPTSESQELDVRAAQRTHVEFSNGKLLIKGPKDRLLFSRSNPSVDVEIALPAGSALYAATTAVHLTAEGTLGDCEFKTSAGDVQVERAARVKLGTGFGEIAVGRANGAADISTGSGQIRVGEATGPLGIKNSNGSVHLGDIEAAATVKTANGAITVDRATADVTLKTSNGAIEVGELVRGTAVLESAAGRIKVGIRQGTAAWLDVRTKFGVVDQELEASDAPGEPTDTLKLQARLGMGDITVHRA
ncbi:DUF4097 family beta strand repeat-containing protein [Streptomyces sp. NPDC052114]|uniref:DUF4097 family beta strand repeat-containing protein n=1 Tax=unclassified Streptomyces TaxID=2593676 RepID=UPI00343ED165